MSNSVKTDTIIPLRCVDILNFINKYQCEILSIFSNIFTSLSLDFYYEGVENRVAHSLYIWAFKGLLHFQIVV